MMDARSDDGVEPPCEQFVAPDFADPTAMAEALGLSLADLGDLVGLEIGDLHNQPDTVPVRAAMRPLAHLIAKLQWMGGSDGEIATWFRSGKIASLGPSTPVELVSAGRIADLELHLEDVLNGVYA